MRLIDIEPCEKHGAGFLLYSNEEGKSVLAFTSGIPTIDAVTVVRCKDCKHYHSETGYCDINSYFVDGDGMSCSPAESPSWTMFEPGDFCSYGERRDGDG